MSKSNNRNQEWYNKYTRYLKSRGWKKKAKKVRKRDKFKCQVCGGKGWIVHHLTYERVGHESLSDLITVCARCHNRIHGR